jgi:hypothetical protein
MASGPILAVLTVAVVLSVSLATASRRSKS